MRTLEMVLAPAALALAVFNAAWSWRIHRARKARLESAHLRADRELERAMGPGNEGFVTRARRAAVSPTRGFGVGAEYDVEGDE